MMVVCLLFMYFLHTAHTISGVLVVQALKAWFGHADHFIKESLCHLYPRPSPIFCRAKQSDNACAVFDL